MPSKRCGAPLEPYIGNADPNAVREAYRDEATLARMVQIRDLLPGLLAAMGKKADDLPEVLDDLSGDILAFADHQPEAFGKKLQRAKERVVFLDPPKART